MPISTNVVSGLESLFSQDPQPDTVGSTTPATNQALVEGQPISDASGPSLSLAESAQRSFARGLESTTPSFGGRAVGTTPTGPVTSAVDISGKTYTPDQLAGVDVQTGAGFGRRLGASFLDPGEVVAILERDAREQGIDVDKNPIKIVEGTFFDNYIFPTKDPKTGVVKEVLFDPADNSSFKELSKDVLADMASLLSSMGVGVVAGMAKGAPGAVNVLERLASKLPFKPGDKLMGAARTVFGPEKAVTLGSATRAGAGMAAFEELQSGAARFAQDIPQESFSEMATDFAMNTAMDSGLTWAGSKALAGAKYAGSRLGVILKNEIQDPTAREYLELIDRVNRKYGVNYQPTAGDMFLDQDLLRFEKFVENQGAFAGDLKRLRSANQQAVESVVLKLLGEFDPNLKNITPADISPARRVIAAYDDEVETLVQNSDQAARNALTQATKDLTDIADSVAPGSSFQEQELMGKALKQVLDGSRTIYRDRSDYLFTQAMKAQQEAKGIMPLRQWAFAADTGGLNRILKEAGEKATTFKETEEGLIANVPKELLADISEIRKLITDHPDGMPIPAFNELRKKIWAEINDPNTVINSPKDGLLKQLYEEALNSADNAADNLPDGSVKKAIKEATNYTKRNRDQFKLDVVRQLIAGTKDNLDNRILDSQVVNKVRRDPKLYFQLKSFLQTPDLSRVETAEIWNSFKRNVAGDIIKQADFLPGSTVQLAEAYKQLKNVPLEIRKDLFGKNHKQIYQKIEDLSKITPRKTSEDIFVPKDVLRRFLEDPSSKDLASALQKSAEASKEEAIAFKNKFKKVIRDLKRNNITPEDQVFIDETPELIPRAIQTLTAPQFSELVDYLGAGQPLERARKDAIYHLFNGVGIIKTLDAGLPIQAGTELKAALRKHADQYATLLGSETYEGLVDFVSLLTREAAGRKIGGESGASLARGAFFSDLIRGKWFRLGEDIRIRLASAALSSPRLLAAFKASRVFQPESKTAWASLLNSAEFLRSFRQEFDTEADYARAMSDIYQDLGLADEIVNAGQSIQPQQQPEPVQQ